MAHEIHENDTPIFVGKPAWHGLGTVIENAPTPMEALQLAKLDWTVETSTFLDCWFGQPDGDGSDAEFVRCEGYKALRRSDTKEILHVATKNYSVMQNIELARLLDDIKTASDGKVQIETAGSLKNGRKVWFLARGEAFDIGSGDTHVPYLLGTNSHDGTNAVRFLPTNIRVVCANTHSAALAAAGGWSWKHTSRLAVRTDEIKQTLARWAAQVEEDKAMYQTLAAQQMTKDEINQLWLDALIRADGPMPKEVKNKRHQTRMERAQDALAYMAQVFDLESQRFGASALVAANAATNWLGHVRGRLEKNERAASNLFGHYARHKAVTFKKALAMA